MRVVSLLPAATEMVAALGLMDALVGVSHECDFPAAVSTLPRVTRCAIHGNALPSGEIDLWVKTELKRSGTLYTMDETLLRRLAPDVIITQRLCDVCAVGWDSVTAFAATLPGPPAVVNLEPQTLADVFGDIRRVATALGVADRAGPLMESIEARIARVRERVAGAPRRRCVLLEWIDPPFASGHWGPGWSRWLAASIRRPGGRRCGRFLGRCATRLEVLVVACCGSISRTRRDVPLRALPGFAELPAAQRDAVWLVDGSAYFSARPAWPTAPVLAPPCTGGFR
jgi:iron complex transport system substrate-binding protein